MSMSNKKNLEYHLQNVIKVFKESRGDNYIEDKVDTLETNIEDISEALRDILELLIEKERIPEHMAI